ncbi:glycosyltransferase family 2 protein [Polaribacter sp. IC073]|uniref:glycosyltransferase family 2 protein n=1 Tax=Polaribacter sp. IC073 TaxID=2508540 RepID=UPI0011BD637E|nr:glycosyltransferase [Polaribacter sp. IC073]TXD49116.1 glycosyltransferase [Polaribacter sp. IC073]
MNNSSISVVIPCYNDSYYITKAINSILNQTCINDIEIIVVDDGSNEKTKNILKELSSKIDLLITQENKGQAAGRNNGIKQAKGKYILVLDSDDFFESTFCNKAVNLIHNDLDIKIVTSYSNILYENSSKTEVYKPKGGDLSEILLNNSAMGSCMFRKRDWEIVEGYDESMREGFEDWEFYIRLLKENGKVEVIKDILFNYRRKTESTTTKANKIKYTLLRYIYSKHEDLYKVHFTGFIDFLLSKIEKEEQEKLKIYSRLEYRIGYYILKPIRFFKKYLYA